MSISNPNPPTIDSPFAISTLPKSKSRSSSSSINSLYEIEYVPGDQLPETTLPLVNPYEYFAKKPSAFSVKGVRELIKPSFNRKVMEYVQSSKFSSCQVPATEEEQFISLNIPENLPRLKSYQQACIGTVQTTLNAGTVFVTLFPNFNVSLQDPNLLKTLKVQLQLTGAPMQEKSVVATLHHQIVYRIQDHALDLVLPSSDEALFLEVTSASQAPNSIQIPRQISREELLRRLPESWITSYEKLHQAVQTPIQTPIQSSEVSFHSRNDDEDGHQYFDICSCSVCEEAMYESDDEIRTRRRKKKDPLYKRYLEGDPTVGPLGEGNGRYDFIVQYSEKKDENQIMMINTEDFPPSSDFTKDNIAHSPKILTRAINSSGPDQLSQGEKVLNWQTENAIAQNQLLKTINYKVDQLMENYIKRQTRLQSSITEIHGRLNNLHQEMMAMAQNMMVNTAQFRHKEAETASLKAQLKDLQRSLESMIYNQNPTSSYSNPFGGMPMYQGTYSPGFLSSYTNQRPKTPVPGFLSSDEAFTSRYGMTSASKPKVSKSKPRRQKDSEFMVNPTKRPTLTSSSSHESVEDSKREGKEIGLIEFSMA
ncbi:hypothetical protein EUTSA_v10027218mg, partial [Eutrema salsugineum]